MVHPDLRNWYNDTVLTLKVKQTEHPYLNPVDRSLQKLADELGLPLKSVIRALEGQWGVSDETRNRVTAAAAANGYTPSLALPAFAVSEILPTH